MNHAEPEPFYIGYQPQAPARVRRWLRLTVVTLVGLVATAALLLAIGFRRLPLSLFEFGTEREYVGVMRAQPYPSLLVKRDNRLEQYWLVGQGKHAAAISPYLGQTVRLRGTLIMRDGLRMLELNPNAIESLDHQSESELATQEIGRFMLVGEIVDSKCYLGVMNPGHTKPHRECAVRCISGGIPPLFIARDEHGQEIAMQLTSAAGTPLNQELLDFVAEPIAITGDITRQGEWLTLRADPQAFLRR